MPLTQSQKEEINDKVLSSVNTTYRQDIELAIKLTEQMCEKNKGEMIIKSWCDGRFKFFEAFRQSEDAGHKKIIQDIDKYIEFKLQKQAKEIFDEIDKAIPRGISPFYDRKEKIKSKFIKCDNCKNGSDGVPDCVIDGECPENIDFHEKGVTSNSFKFIKEEK